MTSGNIFFLLLEYYPFQKEGKNYFSEWFPRYFSPFPLSGGWRSASSMSKNGLFKADKYITKGRKVIDLFLEKRFSQDWVKSHLWKKNIFVLKYARLFLYV